MFHQIVKKIRVLGNHEGFKRYGKNISWLTFEKVVRIALGITVGVWVARHLGPRGFGILSFAESFVGLFGAVAHLFMGDIIVRELLKDQAKQESILGSALAIRVVGSFLLLFLVGLSIPLTNNTEETNIIVIIFAISFFFRSFDVLISYFSSRVLSKYVAIANMISLVTCSAIRVYLITHGGTLILFALVMFLDVALACLLYGCFYVREGGSLFRWNVRLSLVKKILLNSWPLALSGIVAVIYSKIDQIMLKEMVGAEATGHYVAAIRINESISWLLLIVVDSLFPAIINAKMKDKGEYHRRLQYVVHFMILFFVASTIPLMVFSKDIISLLYGDSYAVSAEVLRINALCGFFVMASFIRTKWTVAENLQHFDMVIHCIGAFSNVLFNLFMIKQFGLMGAAYGTLLAHAFTWALSFWALKPLRPLLVIMTDAFIDLLTLKFLLKR